MATATAAARQTPPANVKNRGNLTGCGDFRDGGRFCTPSCRTYFPTNDASPCRNAGHNDRILGACRLPAVSSRPRKTVRWDLVEIAASRTEEGDRELLCNDRFDRKSFRQCERVLTLCPGTADHPRWVETHLWQVLQSVWCYHDTPACFWSAGAAALGEPRC